MDPDSIGELLATRHQVECEPEPDRSVLNFAELARTDDWSFRSALVRLAQAEPERAGATLQLIRRCEASVQPLWRALERHTVGADRALDLGSLRDGGGQAPIASYPDARVTDLARLCRQAPEQADDLIAAYDTAVAHLNGAPLGDEERTAIPLLVPVIDLDGLADVLADWAAGGSDDAPLDTVDTVGRHVFGQLDRLSVPEQTGQGPPRRRR